MKTLEEKNAIVTGSRRGIGHAIVELFAQEGANVWACARTQDIKFEDWCLALSKEHGVEITPIYFDVTNDEEMKNAIKCIRATKRPIDILVNNAGMIPESSSFQMTPIDKMKEVFEVNFFAQLRLSQYVIRLMDRVKRGSIVNIASVAGIDGSPGQLEYSSSKAALILATKKLAAELADSNIRINAVAPGIIDTDMGSHVDDALRDQVLSASIMKRVGEVEEIAEVVAFLASDKASYMTGQVIRVDGGGLLYGSQKKA